MFFSTLVTAAAVAGSLVEAMPASANSENAFSIKQVATGKHKVKSGPIAVASTYKKYNRPVPANVKAAAAAAAAGQSGSVSANPESYDEAYLCPVSIGTPAQTLMLDFDTGSADLWTFSSYQPAGQSSGHTIYTPSSSSTSSRENGETWDISYGDGSGASGIVFSDKVVIGPITATSQAVEAATSVSSEFQSDTANDGLVGLAFDSINTASPNQVPTFIETVAPTLASPLFCANLKHGTAGTYDFGFINSASYTGSITYVNVNTGNGFWQFTSTGYAVGSSTYSASLSTIADTGTSIMYLPATVCNRYWSQVSGAQNSRAAGGYIFPCSASLPNFSVLIGGVYHTVPGSYLNYAPYSGNLCFGALQSSAGIGFDILGDTFLKSQYVVFNYGATQIGFAQQS